MFKYINTSLNYQIILTETIATFIHSEPISTLITAKLCTLTICKLKTKNMVSAVTHFQNGIPILKNVKTYLNKIDIGHITSLNKV